jgi:hypothetical protein
MTTVMILWSIVMGVHCYPILSFIFPPSISTPFWTPVYIGLIVWIITVHSNGIDLKDAKYTTEFQFLTLFPPVTLPVRTFGKVAVSGPT